LLSDEDELELELLFEELELEERLLPLVAASSSSNRVSLRRCFPEKAGRDGFLSRERDLLRERRADLLRDFFFERDFLLLLLRSLACFFLLDFFGAAGDGERERSLSESDDPSDVAEAEQVRRILSFVVELSSEENLQRVKRGVEVVISE